MTLLNITIDSADDLALVRALQHHAWLTLLPGQTSRVTLSNHEDVPIPTNMDYGDIAAANRRYCRFSFDDDVRSQGLLTNAEMNMLSLDSTPVAPTNVREFFEALKSLPFEVATLFVRDTNCPHEHTAGGFHTSLGPALAFKGKGHDRLCSRRMLVMGPWYVHRDEATDLSVIQFHADATTWDEVVWPTAWEQAKRGHYLMSARLYAKGGRYVTNTLFETAEAFPLTYDATRRVYRVHQTGQSRASSTKMADCNALRFHSRVDAARFAAIEADLRISTRGEDRAAGLQRATPLLTEPFNEIEFVYDDVASAYADLMELYIRGFPVYAKFSNGERRIDQTFTPPPPPSHPWIEALKAKYG